MFLEYFDNPEANAKAFDGDWFKTGDMVVLGEGGNLFYRERDKDLLKVGGENVSAQRGRGDRVDRCRRRAGRGRRQAARLPRRGRRRLRDHGARRARSPTTLQDQIIDACRAQLADFKVPRAVYVVDEFPLGTLDKILKNKLREMADAQPAGLSRRVTRRRGSARN